MTLISFLEKVGTYTIEETAEAFNSLEVSDRKRFLDSLTTTEYDRFVGNMRRQAVLDFWENERELLKKGECTRDWTPEQIESIMNIDKNDGKMSTYVIS